MYDAVLQSNEYGYRLTTRKKKKSQCSFNLKTALVLVAALL